MTEIKLEWPNPTGGTAIAYYDDEQKKFSNILHNLNEGGAAMFINWLANMTDLPVYEVTEAFKNYAEIKAYTVTLPNNPQDEIPPWDAIVPHIGYDRQLLGLLWEGKQYLEIADRLHIQSETLRNRISVLRKKYGDKVIPTQVVISRDIA